MSPAAGVSQMEVVDFPRVSGDEPRPLPKDTALLEFSPRERG